MTRDATETATDTLSLIAEVFGPLPGRRLLDIGCGPGALCAALARRGAAMTGLDPDPAALSRAREMAGDAHLVRGSAEALPFADGSFDGAILLNALHHVAAMEAALAEAVRVVASGRPLLVVEPLTSGSFFAALRPVEDETAVREAAQRAIGAMVGGGTLRCLRTLDYDRTDAFADVEAYLARVVAADPRRRVQIAAARAPIEAAFHAAAARDEQGRFRLVQPLRAHVLVAASPFIRTGCNFGAV